MLKYLLVLTLAVAVVSSQTWVNRARIEGHIAYWQNLMQELINELERREWCSLKLSDITQTIDDNLYNMRVTGSVSYTKGFVVSIQKIDLEQVEQLVTSRTIDGVAVPFGTVRGRVNFRDMLVGYNVYANLSSPEGEYRSTGTFLHTLVQIQLDVTQNLVTKETTSSPSVLSVSAGSGVRLQYMPSSNVMEALGRRVTSCKLNQNYFLVSYGIFLHVGSVPMTMHFYVLGQHIFQCWHLGEGDLRPDYVGSCYH